MFDKQKIEITESADARKQPLADEGAWKILRGAGEIIVGKGKKILRFAPSDQNRVEILANCLGRTGNLRAPALKLGNKYIIGFNEEMYEKYLKK